MLSLCHPEPLLFRGSKEFVLGTDAILSASNNGLFNFMLLLLNCFPHLLVEYTPLLFFVVDTFLENCTDGFIVVGVESFGW